MRNADITLQVDEVHKSYGNHEVLRGISMKAKKGDVVSLIGSSGSGKSTFLRCINFLETPDSGRFVINNEEIHVTRGHDGKPHGLNMRKIEHIRRRLGMVFQSFNLWPHMTVLQNVIEAPVHVLKMDRKEAIARGEALLQKVGLYDKRNQYPIFLSGGQQQRVSIARALCMDPNVMLFDEPTSALDPELVGEVLKVIRQLVDEGRTMVLVTHEMRFAREVSNHVMFLHHGQVVEEGPPARVFGDPTNSRCKEFVSSVHH
ncbi:ABC transporter ATP-binding protein [Burkholderia sp. MR1-5-21]